jgi:hypothetical protein
MARMVPVYRGCSPRFQGEVGDAQPASPVGRSSPTPSSRSASTAAASDRKTYNLSWVGKSAGLSAIEAIEGFLAPIFGRVEQLL